MAFKLSFHLLYLVISDRALKAGSQSPLLVTIPGKTFSNAWSVSLLGALHELYVVSKHQKIVVLPSLMNCMYLVLINNFAFLF